MHRRARFGLVSVAFTTLSLAQTSIPLSIPALRAVREAELLPIGGHKHAEPISKRIQIVSFPHREGSGLTAAQGNSLGLECPMCLARPGFERTKPGSGVFGASARAEFLDQRMQFLAGFGGIDTSRPDSFMPVLGRRSRAFDESWLIQGSLGTQFAVDRERRLWLGVMSRYLENLGDKRQFGMPRVHWNTFGPSLNLLLPK